MSQGFATGVGDSESGLEVVFREEQKQKIINIDETNLSLDGSCLLLAEMVAMVFGLPAALQSSTVADLELCKKIKSLMQPNVWIEHSRRSNATTYHV